MERSKDEDRCSVKWNSRVYSYPRVTHFVLAHGLLKKGSAINFPFSGSRAINFLFSGSRTINFPFSGSRSNRLQQIGHAERLEDCCETRISYMGEWKEQRQKIVQLV